MENPVLTILSRIDSSTLPVVPRVLLDLIDATHRVEVNFSELARIIGQDASLSSKVLATANSSFYRQWGEITDLNRVIIVLGLSTVKTIAITRSIQQFFAQIPQNHYDFLDIIWYRSLTCAYLARYLAKLTSYDFPEEAYLTGLIHRLGQLVLLKCFPKEYAEFLANHLDGEHENLEKKLFGAAHNEVGGYLIETWHIQSFISDAVLYQTQPIEAIADSAKLVKIINLANQLSSINSAKKNNIFDLANRLFGLNQSLLEEMLVEVKSSVEQAAISLGIKISSHDQEGIKSLTTPAQRNAVQSSFAEHIKEIALTSAVKQQFEMSTEIKKLVTNIQRDISALFGFQVAAIFLVQQETNSLVGISGDQEPDSLWSTLTINIKPDQSLLAKSLLKKQILHSFDTDNTNPLTIVDRQIRRLLGTEGMLLIPLWENQHAVGVIVSGINQSEIPTIDLKINFITLFAQEVAQALLKTESAAGPNQQTIAELKESYQLQVRKLVHEANNPLSIINNYLHLLGQKLGEEHSDEIRIIQGEIDRVGDIVLSLSDAMEKPVKEENKRVDVNTIIIDVINLFRPGIFKTNDINISLKLDYALPKISSSESKLKQILTNLIKNSAEAMPTGGTLSISTKDQITFKASKYVEIKVQDNGPGLPQYIMTNLFSPVKSTKGKGHSGLGLTICKNLVDELGGTIQCESSTTKGTAFRIFLPRESW